MRLLMVRLGTAQKCLRRHQFFVVLTIVRQMKQWDMQCDIDVLAWLDIVFDSWLPSVASKHPAASADLGAGRTASAVPGDHNILLCPESLPTLV